MNTKLAMKRVLELPRKNVLKIAYEKKICKEKKRQNVEAFVFNVFTISVIVSSKEVHKEPKVKEVSSFSDFVLKPIRNLRIGLSTLVMEFTVDYLSFGRLRTERLQKKMVVNI